MKRLPPAALASYGSLAAAVRRENVTAAVLVGASPRAPEQLDRVAAAAEGRECLFIGLNAGVELIVERARATPGSADWWVWSAANDWRVGITLGERLSATLTAEVVRVWSGNVMGSAFLPTPSPLVPLNYLGDSGFSERAEVGVYSGYTVAYLASQLVLRTSVTHLTLVGVDLSYGASGASRFYGDQNSPTDLHVLGSQIENMRYAVTRLRAAGIEVTTPEPRPTWFIEDSTTSSDTAARSQE